MLENLLERIRLLVRNRVDDSLTVGVRRQAQVLRFADGRLCELELIV